MHNPVTSLVTSITASGTSLMITASLYDDPENLFIVCMAAAVMGIFGTHARKPRSRGEAWVMWSGSIVFTLLCVPGVLMLKPDIPVNLDSLMVISGVLSLLSWGIIRFFTAVEVGDFIGGWFKR